MKVVVCFDDTRITVPCGNGEMLVKDLVHEAVSRYKRATAKGSKVKIRVHNVKSASDDGILDFSDQIGSVVDDREQIIASFEEEPDDLDIHLASDGMSAGSSSTDTWRPDSENSEKNGHPASDASGPKPTHLTHNQRWLLDRSGLLSDDQNGIDIKDDEEIVVKSGLSLSVRRGSESNLENIRDLEDEPQIPQQHPKRWSTAAAVYGQENGRSKIIIPLLPSASRANKLHVQLDPSSDISPAKPNHSESDSSPSSQTYQKSSSAGKLPAHLESSEAEDGSEDSRLITSVVLIPRPKEPVGLHLIPERDIKGLRIQFIDRGSVAEASQRLKLNDCIVDVNGRRVNDLDFGRAQEILRTAVAQGGPVKIGVCSPETTTLLISPVTTAAVGTKSEKPVTAAAALPSERPQRKRTPPPLPPKPKLPYDIETMLQRANYEASLDYTPDVNVNDEGEGLHTYGSLRRPGRRLTIDLLKGPEGLGFTITTRDISAGKVCPIFVKSILPKGAAYKDGRLKTGDCLMEVNGTNLKNKSQEEVVNLLRGIPYNSEVILVVIRPETISPILPRVYEHAQENGLPENGGERMRSKDVMTFEIPLNDTGSAGLGVRVKGKATTVEGENRDEGIFVMNVITGGAASKDGRLQPSDQLININGISLLEQSNHDAMETLRKAMQAHGTSSPMMSITVARDPPLNGSSDSLSQNASSAHPAQNGEPVALNHVVRVPSSQNIYSASPQSDISPPKPPRLYQNMQSVTINGVKNDLVLIEGDDSFAESVPTNSSGFPVSSHNRQDDSKDPYDGDSSMDYDPFNREGFARQSMSEKRHAHLDPRYLETYRKSRAALAQHHAAAKSHTPSPSYPAEVDPNFRRASSLESVMRGPTTPAVPAGKRSRSSANRSRGCNESFRVAVDRSYEAERDEDKGELLSPSKSEMSRDENIEVLETNGSSDAAKKQKKSSGGLLRGWLRRSGNKKTDSPPVSEIAALPPQPNASPAKSSTQDDHAAKARQAALEEQQRINVHYQRFKSQELQRQQAQTYQQDPVVAAKVPSKKPSVSAAEQRPMIVHIPNNVSIIKTNAASGAAVVTNDPYGHYMNYEEIQKVIKRRPNYVVQRQRPVSNFFEYGAPHNPTGPSHPRSQSHVNALNAARTGNGIYGQTTRPLGQIRETSMEKLAGGRPNDNVIYAATGRRVNIAPSKPLSAASLMGSQV